VNGAPLPVETLLAHAGFVRNLARGALGRDDLSDDVAQDAWVAAIEHGPRDPGAVRGWFYRVVQNRVRGIGRSEGRRRRRLARLAAPPPVPSPDEILVREEARRSLVGALLALDPIYREPLVLRYYEDLPPREIARRLELPVETVRTRLKRGVERLRDRLDAGAGGRRAWAPAVLALTRLPSAARPLPTGTLAGLLGGVAAVVAVVVATVGGRAGPSAPPTVRAESAGTVEAGADGTARLVGRGAEGTEAGAAAPRTSQGSFTVTVLDDRGAPVEDATVRVLEERRGFIRERTAVSARTDAEGRAAVPRVERPGPDDGVPWIPLALRVERPPERDDLQDRELPDWRPGDETVVLPRGFLVTGEVLDPAGRPVPGATVHLEAEGRTFLAPTDASGRFRAAGLPPARWRAWVAWVRVGGGGRSREWSLEGGTHGARLETLAEGGISVRLRPPPDFPGDTTTGTLRVTDVSGAAGAEAAVAEVGMAAGGTAWVYGLAKGRRYALWWAAEDGLAQAYAPDVDGGSGVVDLAPTPGASLTVEVVRPLAWEGWPQVTAHGAGVRQVGVWAPNGDCVFSGLPPVEVRVVAEGRDAAGREVHGEVLARPPARVALPLAVR
jgi:RNA polymerase sigma-70 factor (ECF subfamily)